jgi:hypothetical protein
MMSAENSKARVMNAWEKNSSTGLPILPPIATELGDYSAAWLTLFMAQLEWTGAQIATPNPVVQGEKPNSPK